jgi:streptogramin lyase
LFVVAAAVSVGSGCASTERETEVPSGNSRTFPDQRLVQPVNDLPGPYTRVHPWGEIAYDPGNYNARAAVIAAAEGPDGSIYVLTRCNQNSCVGRTEPPILKFNPDGKLIGSWGVGQFEFPHGLTVDREGNVWTADEGNNVVRKFTSTGELLMTIGEVGKAGDPPSHFSSPTGVAIAPNGNIFVTEGHDNSPTAPVARVSKWAPDGKFIKTWGTTGSAPGQFSSPHTIAFDSEGRVFVGDRNNNRIQIFDQEGEFLDLW